MKFNSADIAGLLVNEADFVGKSLRAIGDGQRVVVSQGYGMADKGLPLRVLAYLVPVLHLLKSLPSSVTAEIYFAKAGVLRANGSDDAAIERNFGLLENLILLYISKVHANLKERISILWDADPEPRVDKMLDDLAARSAAIVDEEDAIRHFLEKRGDKALRYMVEHAVYMRDPIDFGLDPKNMKLVPGMRMDMDCVIMVGGPAEKVFHRFRSRLASRSTQHDLWRSLQFFTCIGDTPTYHLKEGEVTWQDRNTLPADVVSALRRAVENIANDYGAKKDVVRDLLYLFLDAGGSKQFNVGGAAKQVLSSGQVPPNLFLPLQRGWDTIRTL